MVFIYLLLVLLLLVEVLSEESLWRLELSEALLELRLRILNYRPDGINLLFFVDDRMSEVGSLLAHDTYRVIVGRRAIDFRVPVRRIIGDVTKSDFAKEKIKGVVTFFCFSLT
jgi:hypothetical protein